MQTEHLSMVKMQWAAYSPSGTHPIIGEQFIANHCLCYIMDGSVNVAYASQTRIYEAGQLLFIRKNSLVKFNSKESINFESIAILFEQDILHQFSRQYDLQYEEPFQDKNSVLKLDRNQLLENYFKTLLPYFALPNHLTILKRQEAIMLLLQINPAFKNILFDFNQPDKINLEAFMRQNFRYNVELKKLAYITGRSLATLKRDFEEIFHTSPGRWLQQRRLEEAYYLIKEKHKRPSEIYNEVGFESLSHFSYAFKKYYGFNPSELQSNN